MIPATTIQPFGPELPAEGGLVHPVRKLLKDPSLYKTPDHSSAKITRLLYDLRQDPMKYRAIRFRPF
jgi:hypothetical protein